MKANELRIGNSVARKSNKSRCIVTTYLIDDIERGRHDYKPIPLTKEWLERFGFGEIDFSRNAIEIGDPIEQLFLCLDDDEEGNCFTTVSLWSDLDYSAVFLNPLNYVHELQNLYFALTGTELEPKG